MNNYLIKKRLGWLLKVMSMLLLCVACSSKQTNDANQRSPKKVIVVHARGLTYPEISKYLSANNAEGFFKQKSVKGLIKKLYPITNAVTISNIASFETGAMPSKHGIIGHLYGLRKNDSIKITSGFAQRFAVETFWEKADLAGKKVLKVGALTLHGKSDKHTNVDCLAQGSQIGGAQIIRLIPVKEATEKNIIKYKSLAGNFALPQPKGFTGSVFIYKSTQDSAWILDNDYNPNNGVYAKANRGDWFELENKTAKGKKETLKKQAFRAKLTSVSNDTLTLYIRPAYENRGYPNGFIKKVDTDLGASRGWPNISFYAANKISAKTLTEEINTEVEYVMKAFSATTQNKDYDLIMVDYPLMDRLGHAFLHIKDSSQEVKQYYQAAYKRMNKDFSQIEDFAKKNGYELMITSGHGFSVSKTSIDLNKLLGKQGIKAYNKTNDWEVMAVPGKVSAHVYLNPQLSENERIILTAKVKDAFQKLQELKTKNSVVDKVYQKNELTELGLFHKNAGDLYVLLKPGYIFENNAHKNGDFWGIPTFKGDHGYSLKHEDSYGVLVSQDQCDPCRSIDVAKVIEQKLKLR